MQFQYAEDEWYTCEIDRKELKALSRRNDATGLLYLGVYAAAVIGSGALAYLAWGTYWAIPALLLYAALYMFAEFIQHECVHGTPFRSRWLNETRLLGHLLHVGQGAGLQPVVARHSPRQHQVRRGRIRRSRYRDPPACRGWPASS